VLPVRDLPVLLAIKALLVVKEQLDQQEHQVLVPQVPLVVKEQPVRREI
jgi:hypothetical protein